MDHTKFYQRVDTGKFSFKTAIWNIWFEFSRKVFSWIEGKEITHYSVHTESDDYGK